MDRCRPLSAAEHNAIQAWAQAASTQRREELALRHARGRERAARIWSTAKLAPADHPYLVSKEVLAHGLRVYGDALVVPVRDTAGELHGLQFIGAGGIKRFLKGTVVQGHCFQIGGTGGPSEGLETVCVAEGFATGASIHEATGHPVAVAFHAGNLAAVAQTIRDKHPQTDIVVCADDDRDTTGNPGVTLARQAAMVPSKSRCETVWTKLDDRIRLNLTASARHSNWWAFRLRPQQSCSKPTPMPQIASDACTLGGFGFMPLLNQLALVALFASSAISHAQTTQELKMANAAGQYFGAIVGADEMKKSTCGHGFPINAKWRDTKRAEREIVGVMSPKDRAEVRAALVRDEPRIRQKFADLYRTIPVDKCAQAIDLFWRDFDRAVRTWEQFK